MTFNGSETTQNVSEGVPEPEVVIMARRSFTRRMSSRRVQPYEWLVLVGDDGSREEWVYLTTPDVDYVRRKFGIPPDVPVLIGRA